MMMKKILVVLLMMVVLACAASATSQEWLRYGNDASNSNWLYATSPLMGFNLNWSNPVGTSNQVVVGDLDGDNVNEIVQAASNILRVYDPSGNILAQKSFGDLGNRQPTIYYSTHCASDKAIYLLGEYSIYEECFDGSSISDYQNTSVPLGATALSDLAGMAVYTYSSAIWGIFAANTSNSSYIVRCRFDSMTCYDSLYNGVTLPSGIAPQGNLNGDSIPDFVFIAPSTSVVTIDAAGTLNTINHSVTGYGGTVNPDTVPMIVKRSSGNDWLAYGVKDSTTTGYGVVDRYGNVKVTPSCYSRSTFASSSNLVQLGTGGDICYSLNTHDGVGGYSNVNLCCYDLDDDLTQRTQFCNAFQMGVINPCSSYMFNYLTSADMNQDGYADFMLDHAVTDNNAKICYYVNTSALNCISLGVTSDWIQPVDADKDTYTDIIIHRSGLMKVFLTNTTASPTPPPTGCSLPACAYPCIFQDNFDYNCSFASMNWTLYPANPTLVPTSGEMCYDAPAVHYSQRLLTAYADEQIITDEFDMNIYDGVTPIHEFVWYDGTDDDYKTTYYLWWEYNGTNANLWVHKPSGGSWVAELLCTDCWDLGVQSHYKIAQFHQNTKGEVFYNTSSSRLEPILPNTYTIIIDSDSSTSFYNLPNRDVLNANHSNLLNDVTWRWYNENVCLDNIQVYAGTVFGAGNFTPSCTYHPNSYEFPVLWMDYFQYNDEITDFGWSGYPFVIGDNPYSTCDILYYDMDKYTGEITHSMSSPIYDDFEMVFDLMPDSTITGSTYDPCGSPLYFYAYDSNNNLALFARFGQTTPDTDGYCNITTENQTQFYDIGKWDGGALNSYKIDVHFDNKTWDFYYTTQDHPYSYLMGASGIGFWNSSSDNIKKFGWKPMTPRLTYQNGFWLDTIKATQTEGIVPANQTNFCYFTGCIYHDNFDYDDAIGGHGWWMFDIIPSQSYIVFNANPYGYDMTHNFAVFRNTDDDGIVTVQTKMLIRPQNVTALNKPHFYVYSADFTKRPLDIYFDGGTISDTSTIPFTALGTYSPDQWYTFTWVMDLNTNTYDFYIDSSKAAEAVPIRDTSVDIGKVGYYTINNEIWIDYITVARGSTMVAGFAEVSDTGVPSEHLKNCWITNKTSGLTSFDWSCCDSLERTERPLWCPTRVTILYGLGNITQFILTNFMYFIVIAIIFVIMMPFIVPSIKGR